MGGSARRLEARPGPAAAHERRSHTPIAPQATRWSPIGRGLLSVCRPGLPPSTSTAAVPSGSSGALHTSGAGSLLSGSARRLEARPGPVDQAARFFETPVAFARSCLSGVETAITFADENRAILVSILVAVVMVVSYWPASAVAEASLVSISPRRRVLRAKKFALLCLVELRA